MLLANNLEQSIKLAHQKDRLRAVFGHDATTFGGSSGTGVIAWTEQGMPSFGLHFAGETSETNSAIAIAKVAAALRAVGVPVV